MSDVNKTNTPMPPMVGWLLGSLAVGTLIIWNYAGTTRTVWWLVLLIAPIMVFFLLSGLKYVVYKSKTLIGIIGIFMVCCLIVSGLTLLFGCAVVVKVVASPFLGSSHSYVDEELPQNWRR
ncbi:hypothetical protein [Sphingobium sp. KCTC 72723]|uniref:hypothetical protein n=1 Tax=Sphingobium sp. KCTC 72723 TaxID=2733867 RepID=UPI00165E322D|nr:hypothetical protein [Sphingobium sp. KCTC 72723]